MRSASPTRRGSDRRSVLMHRMETFFHFTALSSFLLSERRMSLTETKYQETSSGRFQSLCFSFLYSARRRKQRSKKTYLAFSPIITYAIFLYKIYIFRAVIMRKTEKSGGPADKRDAGPRGRRDLSALCGQHSV